MQPSEVVYTQNFKFFLRLLRLIRSARRHIQVDVYIFEPDRLGVKVLDELERAAARGIKVEILVDGYGSLNLLNFLSKNKQQLRSELKVYNPVPPTLMKLIWKLLAQPHRMVKFLATINRRNHKKLYIFDDEVALLGSHNLYESASEWRETSVQLTGKAALTDLASIFSWAWCRATDIGVADLKKVGGLKLKCSNIYFSSNFGMRHRLRKEVQSRLKSARHSVQITMAYFFPPAGFITAILKAARRGVRVEIILPQKTDVWFFPRVSRLFYKTLLRAGVVIYEYECRNLHAKQILIDDWVMVGSSNLNTRSFFYDLEVGCSLEENRSLQVLRQQFAFDKAESRVITLSEVEKVRIRSIFDYFVARIFKSWI